jgi:hypothetical protein
LSWPIGYPFWLCSSALYRWHVQSKTTVTTFAIKENAAIVDNQHLAALVCDSAGITPFFQIPSKTN